MRIQILTTYFFPDSAANGILMSQLAEGLYRLGHQVDVITTFPHYDENRIRDGYRGRIWTREHEGGLGIYRYYLYVPRNKSSIFGRLANYASWNLLSASAGILVAKPDLVFIPSPPLTNGIFGFLSTKLRGVPFIYNVQDIYPDIAIRLGFLKSKRMMSAFKKLEKFVYAKASAVSVISEGFKRNLLLKGVPASKLWTIPNFVDTAYFRPLPRHNAFSKGQGIEDRYTVLFAGNVGLSQGLERVLETALLLRGYPEILFLIVGNGAAKNPLVSLAERMKLDNVRFHPFFPYQDVPDMYASADVCLVPLKRGITEESVPSKVYSILAAGRPLIASVDEESDTWNVVRKAECGICVQPESPQELARAIIDLYQNRAIGLQMGANGRAFVEEHYSRQQIAREYEKMFLSVVGVRA